MGKFISDLLVAFFGVTAALFVNSLHERSKDADSYNAKYAAIQAEAQSNDTIFNRSFRDNVTDSTKNSNDSIIIYRDFELNVVSGALANDNFMSHIPKRGIDELSRYILVLGRLNSFRSAYQRYLENPNRNAFQLYHVRKAIFAEFAEAKRDIGQIESYKF